MDKLKQWIALTVVGALGILAIGWFTLVSPKREEASQLRLQASDQQSANGLLQTQIEVLKAQSKELPEQQATLAAVAAKIPDSSALPALVRALSSASASAGVELVSITPGTPVAAAAPVAAPVQPASGQTTPVAPAVAPPAAGQLASMPVAISIVGDYFEVAAFVAELETLSRAFRVNDLTLAPGLSPTAKVDETVPAAATDGSHLTTTVNGFVFLAPGSTPAPAAEAAAPTSAAANPAVATN